MQAARVGRESLAADSFPRRPERSDNQEEMLGGQGSTRPTRSPRRPKRSSRSSRNRSPQPNDSCRHFWISVTGKRIDRGHHGVTARANEGLEGRYANPRVAVGLALARLGCGRRWRDAQQPLDRVGAAEFTE